MQLCCTKIFFIFVPMKLVAYLLCFIIISMQSMPCGDTFYSAEGTARISVTQDNHADAPQHNDQCTPFCSCNCCQTMVVKVNFNSLEKIPHAQPLNNREYRLPRVASLYYPIWEPPKLV